MLTDEQMVRLFAQAQSMRRQRANILRKQCLRPRHYRLPNQERDFKAIAFIEMERAFTRSLLGECNRFMIMISHAEAWFGVGKTLNENDRMALLWEYAHPYLELTVGRPYLLKNHFSFAAVHLLHQADAFVNSTWKDDLPDDYRITYELLLKRARTWSGWNALNGFMTTLGHLNNEEFLKATKEYRHKSQHRFGLHFDRGLTPVVERKRSEKGMRYDFGVILPLDLEGLLPLLYEQHNQAKETFLAYWNLVLELCNACDRIHVRGAT
jgi:hypothetical protein